MAFWIEYCRGVAAAVSLLFAPARQLSRFAFQCRGGSRRQMEPWLAMRHHVSSRARVSHCGRRGVRVDEQAAKAYNFMEWQRPLAGARESLTIAP